MDRTRNHLPRPPRSRFLRTQLVDEPHPCNYYMLCLPQNDPQRNTRHAATPDSLSFRPFAGVAAATPGVPGTVSMPGTVRAPGAAGLAARRTGAVSRAAATGADRAGPTCRAGR